MVIKNEAIKIAEKRRKLKSTCVTEEDRIEMRKINAEFQ